MPSGKVVSNADRQVYFWTCIPTKTSIGLAIGGYQLNKLESSSSRPEYLLYIDGDGIVVLEDEGIVRIVQIRLILLSGGRTQNIGTSLISKT